MPIDKDFKRLIRARMEKTGEAYTTARLRLLEQQNPLPPDPAAVAGMSDQAVQERTGRTWREWVRVLDELGAMEMAHGDVVGWLVENHEVSGWWAQMVTVGYERLRGLREIGQRLDGTWSASKSRTYGVDVERLFDAFADEAARSAWLPDVPLRVRKVNRPRSIRITWPDDTSVELWFTDKGAGKSSVSVEHSKLAGADDQAARKAWWEERLAVLGRVLTGDRA